MNIFFLLPPLKKTVSKNEPFYSFFTDNRLLICPVGLVNIVNIQLVISDELNIMVGWFNRSVVEVQRIILLGR